MSRHGERWIASSRSAPRNDVDGDALIPSRGTICPSSALSLSLSNSRRRKHRARNAPAASRTKVESARVSHHRRAVHFVRIRLRRSLRNGVTTYPVLPGVPGLIASVACAFVTHKLDPSVGQGDRIWKKATAQSALVKTTFAKRRSTFVVRFRFVLDLIPGVVSAGQPHQRLSRGTDSGFPYAIALQRRGIRTI
jgi:hypothetical protein